LTLVTIPTPKLILILVLVFLGFDVTCQFTGLLGLLLC
jgi:hypothetical protein